MNIHLVITGKPHTDAVTLIKTSVSTRTKKTSIKEIVVTLLNEISLNFYNTSLKLMTNVVLEETCH